MRVRVGGVLLLSALFAGCSGNQQSGLNTYAMATPEPVPYGNADPSFRLNELRVGLTKAQLEALYPNRMVFSSADSDAQDQYFFVEPLNVTTGTMVTRNRLALLVTDGTLAGYDLVRSDDVVMGATEVGMFSAAPPMTPPPGKFGVQIAARNSVADARAFIDDMRARHPALLAQQWATIQRVTLPKGVVYRVVIGPLASAEQAQKLCAGLKARGAECFLKKT